jgi:predicted nucleic acid-binding protein
MALTHLLDTSVLTRLGQRSIRVTVEPRAERAELARAGISDLEIGYSARSAAEWDRLAEALGAFELIETTAEHLRRAKQVQRQLASKHQRGRKIPDLLVAAAAEASNLTVLTTTRTSSESRP